MGGIKVPVLMFAGESDTYKSCCPIGTARALEAATGALLVASLLWCAVLLTSLIHCLPFSAAEEQRGSIEQLERERAENGGGDDASSGKQTSSCHSNSAS